MADEDLLLSRGVEKQVELRGPCPFSTVVMLDAESLSRGMTRTDVVNEILGEWAKKKAHGFTVTDGLLRGNPEVAERFGVRMEKAIS